MTQEEFLQRKVAEWADYITMRMARELQRQKGMTVSKAEILNVRNAVKLSLSQYGAEVGFQFHDAGRFVDMKLGRLDSSGDPEKGKELLAKLTDWVQRTGVQKFKYVPGYKGSPLDQERAARRIALGIFFNRMDGDWVHKRKKWWSHVLYGGLGNLYGKLLWGYGTQATDAVGKMKG